MNMRFVRAAVVACLLGSAAVTALIAPLAPAYAKSSGPSVSAPVAKLLQPAQKAMQANDFKTALDLIKQAQALPDQTAFDTYTINNFLANAALGLKDYATADTAYEAMAESPALPDEDKATTFHNAMLLATQAKHYDKAIKYGQAFLALGGPSDPQIIGTMAQAYYFLNDFANAETMAKKALDATPAGQAPNRAALEIMLSSQIKAKHQDQAMATLEQIVTYYDDADDWGQLIDVSVGVKGIKDYELLHIYRLLPVTKAKGGGDDYKGASSVALSMGYPVEAEAILQSGGLPVGADVRSRAAADRKTIESFASMAAKSPTGELDQKLSETLYGYGRYAEAEAAARRALKKAGAKTNANELNLVLGESLLLQGKTADAVAAFNAISNPSPGTAKAQHLWLLYANRKYSTAAAAPGH
ncbi:MAG TPA: tetratricopeptide repeat protein [Rhizomicrobium sp.]|nr:tetratricopeptide repeat protein [Rhizomicrobium sp.]